MTGDPGGLVPITVLTGYLGAGKTTLLAALLRRPDLRRTAVVVNELGEIGLDHDLLERSEETLLELAGGCLCCTVRGDLVRALDRLWRERARGRAEFDRVVIETTGLADPAPILQTLILDPVVAHRFRLDGVVTLVDAVNGAATLETAPEAVRQAAVADRLVVSKADLVEPAALAALEAALRALNPLAPIHRAVRGALDPAAILECGPWSAVGRRPEVERWLGEVDPPGPQWADGSVRADAAGELPAAGGHGHGARAGHARGHGARDGHRHGHEVDHGCGPGDGAGGGLDHADGPGQSEGYGAGARQAHGHWPGAGHGSGHGIEAGGPVDRAGGLDRRHVQGHGLDPRRADGGGPRTGDGNGQGTHGGHPYGHEVDDGCGPGDGAGGGLDHADDVDRRHAQGRGAGLGPACGNGAGDETVHAHVEGDGRLRGEGLDGGRRHGRGVSAGHAPDHRTGGGVDHGTGIGRRHGQGEGLDQGRAAGDGPAAMQAHGSRASAGLDHPAAADRRQVSGHGHGRGAGNGAGDGHRDGDPRARAPRAGPGGGGPAEEPGRHRAPGPGDGRASGKPGGGTDAVGDAAPAEAHEGGRAERPGDGRRQGPREARPNGAEAGPGEGPGSVPARHASGIRTFCVRRAEPISAAAASLFLTLLGAQRGPDLLRVKGILAIREDPDRPLVVHAVQHVVHEPVELDHWPSADRSSRLVMVTRDLAPEAVEALWDAVVEYEATAGAEPDRASA